ncbi:hypothetical protein F2Q68_00004702 [Brassica cretica]|uniref:Uncharacterized protein n=1 Tax=Brassica cretica TaxID=69181 RepID=A0A8S9JMV9_BRACR|nr:hypothetical protein F2Q68_00004702 [Brassica cretica]
MSIDNQLMILTMLLAFTRNWLRLFPWFHAFLAVIIHLVAIELIIKLSRPLGTYVIITPTTMSCSIP